MGLATHSLPRSRARVLLPATHLVQGTRNLCNLPARTPTRQVAVRRTLRLLLEQRLSQHICPGLPIRIPCLRLPLNLILRIHQVAVIPTFHCLQAQPLALLPHLGLDSPHLLLLCPPQAQILHRLAMGIHLLHLHLSQIRVPLIRELDTLLHLCPPQRQIFRYLALDSLLRLGPPRSLILSTLLELGTHTPLSP